MEQQKAYDILKKGISSLDFEGTAVPSELLLTGDEAFPVAVNGCHQVLVAASRYGKGRLVALGHESYLESPKFAKFIVNAVTWLRQDAPQGAVSVAQKLEPLKRILESNGVTAGISEKPAKNAAVHCAPASCSPEQEATLPRELVAFVKAGGGLLIGGQAWNWANHHKGKDVLSHFPGNKISGAAGVYFLGHAANKGVFNVRDQVPANSTILRQNIHWADDYAQLVAGIKTFTVEGSPSQLVAHGSTAFPVVIDAANRTIVAAARHGEGRVVVLGHEGLMSTEAMRPFVLNAVRWLDAGRAGKVGVANVKGLAAALSKAGMSAADSAEPAPGLAVFCCSAYVATEPRAIHEFVAEGGGLMIGGHAWLWASKNQGKSVLSENPANRIVNKFGIGILGSGVAGGSFPPIKIHGGPTPFNVRYAACNIFRHLVHKQAGDPREIKNMSVCLMQDYVPLLQGGSEDACFKPFQQVGLQIVAGAKLPAVGKDAPVHLESTDGFLMALANAVFKNGAKIEKNMPNLGQKFPGMPVQTTAAKGIRNVTINGDNPGADCWRSTGLYAPPTTTIHVMVPNTYAKAGLQIQIGAHTDVLFGKKEPVVRHPAITRRFPVNCAKMEIGSCWGGLLYVVVPKHSKLGSVLVQVDGAVQAPWFRLGESSIGDWQQTTRHYPAPWAEFENGNVIVTIPSTEARTVNNPESLMKLWDKIMQAVTTLSATPFPLPRPERFVADVQIAIGLMHSGYPIMLNVSCVKGLIDEKCMAKGMWASIHELGHNQQCAAWEFPPHTTEATANLWPTYVHETILSIARQNAHQALQPAKREQRIKDHLKKGSKLANWSVWTCLESYLQLQEAFGWEMYMKIFAAYQHMDTKGLDKAGKMNLWAETVSKQVNKNLAPFYIKWGLPITDEVVRKLGALPEWKENPMLKFK